MDSDQTVTVPSGVTPYGLSKALGVRLPRIIVLLMERNILKTVKDPLSDEEVRLVAQALQRDVQISG